jgi:hypothetical protein
VDWHKEPESFRYGVFIKKREITKRSYNPISKTEITALRGDPQYVSANILNYQVDPLHVKFLVSKLVTPTEFPKQYELFKPIPDSIENITI